MSAGKQLRQTMPLDAAAGHDAELRCVHAHHNARILSGQWNWRHPQHRVRRWIAKFRQVLMGDANDVSVQADTGGQSGVEPPRKQYLTFMLGTEMFSINILQIKEINLVCRVDSGADEFALHNKVINSAEPLFQSWICRHALATHLRRSQSTCIVIMEILQAGNEHQAMVWSMQAVLEIAASRH